MLHLKSEVFLTEQDPNYRIKGSRDPLGFQMVWTRIARKLIKHVSSVSSGIRDFQTLLYGHYLFDQIGGDRKHLLEFFLKFEQASAYARRLYLDGDTFNGTDYVAKKVNEEPDLFFCSTSTQDQILSNQKAYGIWGKYSRPFRDLQLYQRPEVSDLLSISLSTKGNLPIIVEFVERLCRENRTAVSRDELKELSRLYETLTPEEISFFQENLLKVPEETHLQNEFYGLLVKHPELLTDKTFHLFSFVKATLSLSDLTDELRECFELIRDTEKVLFQLHSFFRWLQTRPVWTHDEVNNDKDLLQFNQPVERVFCDAELGGLNHYLAGSLFETAEYLARRNKEVCSRRGQESWISEEGERLMVNYREGGGRISRKAFDNSYFIECYISLFRQVKEVGHE